MATKTDCTNIVDLCITKGDDKEYMLAFTDNAGVAIDITGSTVYFTCKARLSDDDTDALIQKIVTNHSDPTNGKTVINLTHGDTDIDVGRYYYDVQWKTVGNKIKTVMKGALEISWEATEAS